MLSYEAKTKGVTTETSKNHLKMHSKIRETKNNLQITTKSLNFSTEYNYLKKKEKKIQIGAKFFFLISKLSFHFQISSEHFSLTHYLFQTR